MKSVGIVTDSHSSISPEMAKELGIFLLPMPFYVGDECYYEEVSITREEFFEKLNNGENVTTSQPSPDSVMGLWRECLAEYDEIIYFPISSGLSGACGVAIMLSKEEEFEGKVHVVDNGRVSTPMHRSIMDAIELVKEGYTASEIKNILEDSKDDMSIYIAVETLEYLKKGGRVTPAAAAIGSVLNIKPILKLSTGVLDNFKKCRGMKKARREMLEAMKEDMQGRFKESYERNEIYLLAATSADEETTKGWIEEIEEYFPGMTVLCDNLSLGISCHTGEGALGIGCSCRPRK